MSNKIAAGIATDAGSSGNLTHGVNRYTNGPGIFDAIQCSVMIYDSNPSNRQLSGVLEAWYLDIVLYLHLCPARASSEIRWETPLSFLSLRQSKSLTGNTVVMVKNPLVRARKGQLFAREVNVCIVLHYLVSLVPIGLSMLPLPPTSLSSPLLQARRRTSGYVLLENAVCDFAHLLCESSCESLAKIGIVPLYICISGMIEAL